MSAGTPKGKGQFKDYFLILQVHPEADAAMIDAAYWHLAMRYNEASMSEQHRRRKLEDLNEAYAVLGSADRRDEYLLRRGSVLGVGALPVPPPPDREKPPLTVMQRQRPRERQQKVEEGEPRTHWGPALLSSALALPIVLGVGIAAFLAGDALTVVAALLAGGLLLAVAPLVVVYVRLRPRLRLPSMRRLRSVRLPSARRRLQEGQDEGDEPPDNVVPIDAERLKQSIHATRRQLRDDALSVANEREPREDVRDAGAQPAQPDGAPDVPEFVLHPKQRGQKPVEDMLEPVQDASEIFDARD